jgi:hypothetical protein
LVAGSLLFSLKISKAANIFESSKKRFTMMGTEHGASEMWVKM